MNLYKYMERGHYFGMVFLLVLAVIFLDSLNSDITGQPFLAESEGGPLLQEGIVCAQLIFDVDCGSGQVGPFFIDNNCFTAANYLCNDNCGNEFPPPLLRRSCGEFCRGLQDLPDECMPNFPYIYPLGYPACEETTLVHQNNGYYCSSSSIAFYICECKAQRPGLLAGG